MYWHSVEILLQNEIQLKSHLIESFGDAAGGIHTKLLETKVGSGVEKGLSSGTSKWLPRVRYRGNLMTFNCQK